MTKYKFILSLDGKQIMDSYDDEGNLYETYEDAVDAALYYISCFHTGGEILELSNPGDYPYDETEEPEYDIEEEAQSTAQAITSAIPNSADANEDELFEAVKEWAMSQDYASMSRIQREFSIGFNRAGRLFKRLQDEGIVASKPDTASSAKGCRVLVKANKFAGDSEDGETEEEINTGE